MDHMLKCNALKCRKELSDRALVTTCSHIFCTECAARLGLTGPTGRSEQADTCPACNTHLSNPDDAVVANLNPSEDYKTSVLSGLSPQVIMECASRALSFWAYQTTQEVVYQEHLGRTLTEKYSTLSAHLDKVINEANSHITTLQTTVSTLNSDHGKLRKKNEELAQVATEKNRKLMQVQELYDKLKHRAMMGHIQDAAEDAADSSLGAMAGIGGGVPTNVQAPDPGVYKEPALLYKGPGRQSHNNHNINEEYGTHDRVTGYSRPFPRTMGAQTNDIPITPSSHRQRLGHPAGFGLSSVPGLVPGLPQSPRQLMNARTPTGTLASNRRNTNKYPTVGLSSGLKVSLGGDHILDTGIPRPQQVIQRPTPATSTASHRRDQYHQPESVVGSIRSASISGNMRSGFTSR